MLNVASRLIVCVAVSMSVASPVLAQDKRPSVTDVLNAVSVKRYIRVHDDKSDIRYTVDDEGADTVGNKLEAGQVFKTKTPVKITFQYFNPLTQRVSVKVKKVDNTSSATIAKLIEALTGVATTLKPAAAPTAALSQVLSRRVEATSSAPARFECVDEVTKVFDELKALTDILYDEITSAGRIKSEYTDKWAGAITKAFLDGKNGTAAISDSAAAMQRYVDALKNQIDDGQEQLDQMVKNASRTPTSACDAYAVAAYQGAMALESHQYQGRLEQLGLLLQKVVEVRASLLKDFGQSGQWVGHDYVAAKDIVVTMKEDADVTVDVTPVSLSTSNLSFSTTQGDPVSTAFTVQFDSGWVTEIGVGVTTAIVKRPTFGTSQDANGQTIVTRTDSNFSVDPTIMVNFLPVDGGLSLLKPVVQIGAAISKETPAVFVGGGWRVFGHDSGFMIGGGLVAAFVKTLDKLKVNDPVKGTSDIEADLKFDPAPVLGGYFTLHYKF